MRKQCEELRQAVDSTLEGDVGGRLAQQDQTCLSRPAGDRAGSPPVISLRPRTRRRARVQLALPERGFLDAVHAVGADRRILMNLSMMLSLVWENWLRLAVWLAIGLAIYFSYGRRPRRLATGD